MFPRAQTLAFVLEAGTLAILLPLAGEIAAGLRWEWRLALSLVLPAFLILGLRRAGGESWTFDNLGVTARQKPPALETLWLLAFQTTYLMGILLYLGRFHFLDLLDFLELARRKLNGYPANYAAFLAALGAFLLIRAGWAGELLHRGYFQGLGTVRFNAAAGALISWITFGAAAASLAIRLDYRDPRIVILPAIAVLLPGPLWEAYYFRNRTILPLIAIRTAGGLAAFSAGGLFLYWHPERALALGIPFFALALGIFLCLSVFGRAQLRGLWWTAWAILEGGLRRGAAVALAVGAVIVSDSLIRSPVLRLAFCIAGVTALCLRSGPRSGRRPAA